MLLRLRILPCLVHSGLKSLRLQSGQSMIEYTVVTVFGILVLTTGPGGDVIRQLADAIRNNYDGYAYAVSLSDLPDESDPADVSALYASQGMPVEQINYLADVPEDMLSDLLTYDMNNFPNVDEGPDLLNGLGDVSELCSSDCPLSFSPF